LIPLIDFQRQWQDTREAALAAFEEVGCGGWYILGRQVAEFERELARYWGVRHAAGVGNGLDALEISLKTLGCKAGDKVLTTPLSAFPTTLAILKLGAIPVFADTDEFGLIDLEACRSALASRPEIRYFLPVHLYGHALDMRRLAALGAEFGCRMVEDCAQSIGASHHGIPTGSAGQMSALSFYPTKNLGALGDGGAVLTGDAALDRAARMLRDYGQSAKYRHELVGYNSRLDELHGAYLRRVALPRLPAWTEARRRIAAVYLAEMRNEAICVLGAPPGSNSSWHLFPVLVAPGRKPEFLRWMEARGIGCGEHYPIPIPEQPAMAAVPFETFGSLAAAARICRSEVSLPIHPYLTDGEIAQVIDACNAWPG
jgi:dTDP-3-amino-3,4,6-trideoxy-alpha-D-glucose transaminase